MEKLYVITRNDLKPGLQLAQSCHTVWQFREDHPDLAKRWYEESNNIACLQVPDEATLVHLATLASQRGIAVSAFREIDLDDEITGIALMGEGVGKLTANLPLALRLAA